MGLCVRLSLRAGCIGVLLGLTVAPVWAMAAEPDVADGQAPKLFQNFCFDCHGDGASEGGLDLESILTQPAAARHHSQWLAVWKNLRAQTMPPADAELPEPSDRAAAVTWIERHVFQLDPAHPDPGNVTMRRLNRYEYENTIFDLLGIRFHANEAFPADDTGYGFDTIGAALSISPVLTEKYLQAAEQIVEQLLADRDSDAFRRIFFEGSPSDDATGNDATQRTAHARRVLERFASRAFRRPVDPPTLDRLVELQRECLSQSEDDMKDPRWVNSMDQALTAILVSPRFLFRAELQPDPDDRAHIVDLDGYALASRLSYFLWSSLPDERLWKLAGAGRLRAQLDAEVERMLSDPKSDRFIKAFVGQWLQTRDVTGLHIDARRVLGLRSLEQAQRIFNPRVRRAMQQETELLFAAVLRKNRPATELLTADYTFLNQPLANFYGIPDVRGKTMRRVQLDPARDHRRGILTHGSVLVITSNPTRTSPVKRGLFILENLLATPPPPPPPGVPPLAAAAKGQKGHLSNREILALHRENPLCASCHDRMDPLGLALENYNAIGRWRTEEKGQPIDSSGELLTGEKFSSVLELAQILAEQRKTDFCRCLAEKMLTYALGRGVEYYDAPAVEAILKRMDQREGQLKQLVLGIVHSAPFQKRRGGD